MKVLRFSVAEVGREEGKHVNVSSGTRRTGSFGYCVGLRLRLRLLLLLPGCCRCACADARPGPCAAREPIT